MTLVPAGERGVVRVFAVDLPDDQAAAFVTRDPQSSHGTRFDHALVPDVALDPDFIEVFPVSQLSDFGHADLYAYLAGSPLKPADLAHNAVALHAQRGWVVLIWSDAFGGSAARLRVKAPIRQIAALRMTDPAPRLRPSEKAWVQPRPRQGRTMPVPPDPRRLRNALTGLALLAVVIVGFVLVYGGMPGDNALP